VAAALVALGLQTAVMVRTGFLMGDFHAFYCAARAVSQGRNPYYNEPLRTCEVALGPKLFFARNPGVTIPAPLPGYALAALVPIAVLPFGAAAAIWIALLALACAACVVTLARFSRASWEVALAALSLTLCAVSLPFGEVVPLALAGICGAAYFAWQMRWRNAALCAAGAMIEPHLGLPVCAALALWAPGTRLTLLVAAAAIGGLSLAVLGVGANVEYFTAVLPAHALSEIARDTQFSLTAVLAALGVSQTLALRAGMLWYLLMIVAGVVVGGVLARRTANNALLACVPAAFAVFGGTFMHITQIAAALPAAVLLTGYAQKTSRTLALAALVLLAVPWLWVVSPVLALSPVVPVAYLVSQYTNENTRAALVAALAAALLLWGLNALVSATPHNVHHGAPRIIDPRLAEAAWSTFTQKSTTSTLAAWMLRLPTWLGLGLLLALLARQARTAQ
jgi:hypothetical protein